jgi:hypothetical protein
MKSKILEYSKGEYLQISKEENGFYSVWFTNDPLAVFSGVRWGGDIADVLEQIEEIPGAAQMLMDLVNSKEA